MVEMMVDPWSAELDVRKVVSSVESSVYQTVEIVVEMRVVSMADSLAGPRAETLVDWKCDKKVLK